MKYYEISIHAPRGGSDDTSYLTSVSRKHFNPRSPWGERQKIMLVESLPEAFQSTLPVGGATSEMFGDVSWENQFQSTLPVGGATG